MRKVILFSTLFVAMLLPLLYAASAEAQASRTWVSGVGDDANPCSRTAPCKTYAGAISKTAAGGEINCLDPGGFGAVTITKSISIVCDYTEGGVLSAGTTGFIINMGVAGNIVTLKGQDVECFITGLHGVRILGAAVTVHIHKSQIRNCRGGGSGITIAPSSGVSKVFVADTYITGNGNSATQAGILVRPTGGASANVSVNNVKLQANSNGILMDGAGGGGISNVNVTHSELTASTNAGISVSSAATAFAAVVSNSQISFNVTTGALTTGAGATLRLGDNTITNNVTGVAGTGVQSFKNNQIVNNGTDGTPLTAVNSGGNILN